MSPFGMIANERYQIEINKQIKQQDDRIRRLEESSSMQRNMFLVLLVSFGLGLIFLVFATSCGPVHQIIDPNAGDINDCAPACDNMASLKCPGWKGNPGEDQKFGTDDDISCEEICIRVTRAGIGLEQACVAAATDCDEIERCQNN